MPPLMGNPAFATYALCSAVLALEMILAQRRRNQGYANPEDAHVFGKPGATAAAQDPPAVAHTIFYLSHTQPWRAIAYGVGALCMLGMIVQIVLAAL